MRRKLTWTMCLLAVSLCAQVAPPPKYKVVATGRDEEVLPLLNHLAEQGYRLIVPGPMNLLRLGAPTADHYRYDSIPATHNVDRFFAAFDEQGAQGYRWIPFSPLMEKGSQSTKFRYRKAHHGLMGPAKAADISSAAAEGYAPVSVMPFPQILGADKLELVLEQELPPATGASTGPFQVVDALRADHVMKLMNELAKQGYRYASPHVSNRGGGTALVMAKCLPGCSQSYDYRYFDAKNPEQVEQELNALGKDGFRVVPGALRTKPRVLERDPSRKETYSYRVLDPKDPAALEKAVNDADRDGFTPVGYVGHVDWKLTIHFFLVLEKPAEIRD